MNKFPQNLKDYFLSQEEFYLVENSSFGYLETHPIPENLSKYYESEKYISHTDSAKNWLEKIYQLVKNYNIAYKFSKLEGAKPGMKILDYGCGAGDFLAFAQKKNLDAFGVEPNPVALQITHAKIGKDRAVDQPIESLSGEFDFITLWHVLEHIADLENFILNLKTKLKPEGKIYIAVPNYHSYDAQFYKEYWAAYDVPRHLWHFSPESLNKLFSAFGMKIEKTFPLWFDSYYVSLLSEKYKKNPFGLLRAVWIGSLSNLKAMNTGNYSSIIYQISKN